MIVKKDTNAMLLIIYLIFFSPVGEAGEYVVGWQGRPVLFNFYYAHYFFTQIFCS